MDFVNVEEFIKLLPSEVYLAVYDTSTSRLSFLLLESSI